MQALVVRSELLSALTSMHRIMPVRHDPQILIEAFNDTMSISITNSMHGLTVRFPAQVNETGQVLLPLEAFEDFLACLTDEFIQVKVNDVLEVKAGKMRGKFATQNMDTYTPAITGDDPFLRQAFIMDAQTFIDTVMNVSVASATKERANGREFLTCMLFHPQINGVDFVCSDGLTMAHQVAVLNHELLGQVLVPAMELKSFCTCIKKDAKDVAFRLTENGHVAVFSVDDTADFFATTMSGQFPNFNRAYPPDYSLQLSMPTKQLRSAIDCCLSYKSSWIKLDISKNNVHAHTTTDIGSADTDIDAEINGSPLQVSLNLDYLNNIARQVKTENFMLRCDPGGQCKTIVMSPDGDQVRYTVMPLART